MKRKRRTRFIQPVEESKVLNDGFIGKLAQSKEDDITHKHYYVLTALFPDHKLMFVIDCPKQVKLIETGPNAIVARLKRLGYEIPEYLTNLQESMSVLFRALNTAVYGRLQSEGHQIEPDELREKADFWLYHATDDEIRAITNEILMDGDETKKDVTLRFFLHFRHMAIDTIAGMQAAEGDIDGRENDPSTETET